MYWIFGEIYTPVRSTYREMSYLYITNGMHAGAAWYMRGTKAKIDYLILDAKFLLININYIEFFLFF